MRAVQAQVKWLLKGIVRILGGVLLGLLVAGPLGVVLSFLPEPVGRWMVLLTAIVAVYLGVVIALNRSHDLQVLIKAKWWHQPGRIFSGPSNDDFGQIVVDVSALLDGRVLAVATAGWLLGRLLIARSVVRQLEELASSDDRGAQRRGEYGLEVLEGLQKQPRVAFKLIDTGRNEVADLNSVLIGLARQLHAKLLTNDVQLTMGARREGIGVLNIDELKRAAGAIMLPGEDDYPPMRDLHFHF